MYCTACGHNIPDDQNSRFCPECGTPRLDTSSPVQQSSGGATASGPVAGTGGPSGRSTTTTAPSSWEAPTTTPGVLQANTGPASTTPPATIICMACGHRLSNDLDSRFCSECGTALPEKATLREHETLGPSGWTRGEIIAGVACTTLAVAAAAGWATVWRPLRSDAGTPAIPTRTTTPLPNSTVVSGEATRGLVVDQTKSGGLRTIGDALRVAPPGTTIRVRPGTYREAVQLTSDVELQGEGTPGDVVIEVSGLPAVTISAGSPMVRGFVIRGGAEGTGALTVTGGRPVIEGCAITATNGTGIHVRGIDADPQLRDCTIRDCVNRSVVISQRGRGTFERCAITGGGISGIQVTDGGNPTIVNCIIRKVKGFGIVIEGNSSGSFRGCDSSSNTVGIGALSGGNPLVQECAFLDNLDSGIIVNSLGRGTFERCETSRNNYGIYIGAMDGRGGDPAIRNCLIRANKFYGVQVRSDGQGTITGCQLEGNAYDWFVESGAGGTRTGNKPEAPR